MLLKDSERVRWRPDRSSAETMAKGLGWFSLALGGLEAAAPGGLARWLGLKGHGPLLQAYGAREIVSGAGILATKNSVAFVWARVAGDLLDIATLAAGYKHSHRKLNLTIAMGSVLSVTVLDVICAQALGQEAKQDKTEHRDYSDRSGFPRGVEASRGLARQDQDVRSPAASGTSPRSFAGGGADDSGAEDEFSLDRPARPMGSSPFPAEA